MCRRFGNSVEGNWYREGLTDEERIEYVAWKKALLDELLELQFEFEQAEWCAAVRPGDWTVVDGKEEYKLEGEWYANRARDLDPTHHWNIASVGTSLFCLLVWVVLSPHRAPGAERLDLSCMCTFEF